MWHAVICYAVVILLKVRSAVFVCDCWPPLLLVLIAVDLQSYLMRFQWDMAKFPINQALKSITDQISKQMSQIEADLKNKASNYNSIKGNLLSLEKKAQYVWLKTHFPIAISTIRHLVSIPIPFHHVMMAVQPLYIDYYNSSNCNFLIIVIFFWQLLYMYFAFDFQSLCKTHSKIIRWSYHYNDFFLWTWVYIRSIQAQNKFLAFLIHLEGNSTLGR